MTAILKRLWGRVRDTAFANLAERAAKTFAQGFVVVFVAGLARGVTVPGLKALVLAALMAGLSAVTTTISPGPGTSGPVVPGEVPPELA